MWKHRISHLPISHLTCKAMSEPALLQPQRLRYCKFLQCCASMTSPLSEKPMQPLRSSISSCGHPFASETNDESVRRAPFVKSKALRLCQLDPIASIAWSLSKSHRLMVQHSRLVNLGATDCTSLLTLRPHLSRLCPQAFKFLSPILSNLENESTEDNSTKQDQVFHYNLVQGITGIG